MIAISTTAASQTSDPIGRTGSLRRIDEILAELFAGYAVIGNAVTRDAANAAANDTARPAVGTEPLVAGLVALPGGACCTAAAESAANV